VLISIDAAKCMGHGRCYSVAPDLLSDDDEGFVAQSGQTFEIPEGLLGQAQEAAEGCPEQAITLLERSTADA
jgi:ferredoxin